MNFVKLTNSSLYSYERCHQLLKSLDLQRKKLHIAPNANLRKVDSLLHQEHGFVEPKSEEIYEVYSPNDVHKLVPAIYLPHIDPSVELTVLKWLILNSVRVQEGFVFLHKSYHTNGLPLFAKNFKVFKQEGRVKIVGRLLRSIEFIRPLYSFRVEEESNLIELDLSKLRHYDSLIFANFNGLSLVLKNFYIPDRFSKFYDFD